MGDKGVGEVEVRYRFSPNPSLLRKVSVHQDSNYKIHDVDLSFQLYVDTKSWPDWLRYSGPKVSAFYSHTSGNFRNNDSHRDQFGGNVGYRQRFWEVFFIEGNLGFSKSYNVLNFGGGTMPYRQESTNMHYDGSFGVELCFGSPICASVGFGYQGDHTIAGEPDYMSQGVFVTGAVAVQLPVP